MARVLFNNNSRRLAARASAIELYNAVERAAGLNGSAPGEGRARQDRLEIR